MGKQHRRLGVALAGAVVAFASLGLVSPASAAPTCSVAAPTTFVMAGGKAHTDASCATDTVQYTVTGTGPVTFDLTGGQFEAAGSGDITFLLDLTGSDNDIVVTGSSGSDNIAIGDEGLNFALGFNPVVVSTNEITKPFADQIDSVTVNAGAGDDRVDAEGGPNGTGDTILDPVTLNGGDGSDTLLGGAGADTLNGDAHKDSLTGHLGNDTENGGTGRDTFFQESDDNGGDTMAGGADLDTISYALRSALEPVSVTINGAADDGEALELDNVSETEVLVGGDGNDTLTGMAAGSPRYYLRGGEGDDVLTGGTNKDDLRGGDGNDDLFGLGERDLFRGGEGADDENGGDGVDTFFQDDESNGADDLDGAGGNDIVSYASRRVRVVVTTNESVGAGNDGQAGEGDDVVDIEKIKGGRKNDRLVSKETVNTWLYGNAGDDELVGLGGPDKLYGKAGNDLLQGGDGPDKLYGGSGNDILQGGNGTDYAAGGTGADSCSSIENGRC